MKRFLNWKIVVLLLFVLGAAGSVYLQKKRDSEADLSLKQHLPEFQTEAPEKIILSWKKNVVTLVFSDGKWRIQERGGHPADMGKVGRLIEAVQRIRPLRRAVPGDKEMCSLLRVNPEETDPRKVPGVRIRMFDAKGNSLRDLTFGAGYFTVTEEVSAGQDPEPSGRWAGIVKADGSVIPFLISSMFEEYHPVPGSWISCPVFEGLDQIYWIGFEFKGQKWMLARMTVEDPFSCIYPGSKPVSRQNINQFFNVLSQRYVYDGIRADAAGTLTKVGSLSLQDRNHGYVRSLSFYTSEKVKGHILCRVHAQAKKDSPAEKQVREFMDGRDGWLYMIPERVFETIKKNPAGE
ncbi:MAG: hypothetical protein IJW05_09195 [Lentisphaeria bacterium]|nr:hypothetical protein [Lentisphaeria bacterium]